MKIDLPVVPKEATCSFLYDHFWPGKICKVVLVVILIQNGKTQIGKQFYMTLVGFYHFIINLSHMFSWNCKH